jgi:two-component system, OmpR family, sensor kinase
MGILGGARTRILLSYMVLLGFSAVASTLLIGEILSTRADDRLRDALVQEVEEFRRLASGRDPNTGRAFGADVQRLYDVFLARNVPGEGETIATFINGTPYRTVSRAQGGRVQFSSLVTRLRDLEEAESGELTEPGVRVRYLAVPVVLEGRSRGTFVVAADLAAEIEDVNEAVTVVALVLGGVLLLASALAWMVAGRVLAPLRLLSETAQSIGESDLTRRIPVQGDDELARLSATFNAMLDRLEAAFASQRDFVNDAGHELRTPITIIRGHLELLGDDPEERRETVAIVTDELDRMTRFVDDLLLLAKLQRGGFLHPEQLDLGSLTDELVSKAQGLGDRAWVVDGRGEGTIEADRQRLTQALMGLAQNAVQHTAAGDEIGVGSEVRHGEARLWVRDTGPGVRIEDRGRIFERFARATNAPRRSEGAGLGLSIVRAIAEAHGGRVELESSPGVGARFTLVVPLESTRVLEPA